MSRLAGTIAALLVLVIALPAIAEVAQQAIPLLISLLVLLAVLYLAFPPRRHAGTSPSAKTMPARLHVAHMQRRVRTRSVARMQHHSRNAMEPPIPITVTKKTEPDLERFAAALLALAMARVEAAERPKAEHSAKEADGD